MRFEFSTLSGIIHADWNQNTNDVVSLIRITEYWKVMSFSLILNFNGSQANNHTVVIIISKLILKMRVFSAILVVSLILVQSTQTAPVFRTRRWNTSLVKILNDILTNYFPACDLILMQDTFFSENMNAWVAGIQYPYYSITLDGKRFPDYTTWQKITKTTGFLCSTIVAICTTFETCRNSDSPTLFKMLSANGILLKERRAILYIDKFPDEDMPYTFSNFSDKWTVTYENPIGQEYKLPVLNKAKHVLNELKSHITIIRDVTELVHKGKMRRYSPNKSANTQQVLNSNSNSNSDLIYETLTFSPNWLPGGTPLIPNLWSKKRGFNLPYLPTLNVSQIKPESVVTFCVASKHLLPFINVAPNGTIDGLGAAIIKVFSRHLKIKPEFFEPKERFYKRWGPHGNWSGSIGFVIRKEADIGLGHVIFSHSIIEAVITNKYINMFFTFSGLKMSPLVVTLNAVAVCPIPQLLPRYQILSYPFETTTWIYLLISFVLSVVVIEVLQRVAIRLMPTRILISKSNSCRGQKGTRFESVCESKLPWIQSVGPIFLRSVIVNPLPRRWAILGLFSVWLLFTFITAATYVTLLIGALSVPPREPYVRSPADLVRTKKEWAVSSVVSLVLENSTIPTEIKLAKGATSLADLPAYQNLAADIQVFNYVNDTGNCGVSEEYRTKFYVPRKFFVVKNNQKRQLMYVSKGSFFIGATGWVLRDDMDFTLETYFDNIFLDMSCYGLHVKIMEDWAPKGGDGGDYDEPIQALNFETVQIVFVFGAVGLLGSFLVFLSELLVYRIHSGLSVARSRLLFQQQQQHQLLIEKEKKENELFPFTW